jgi:hypothetical protein
MTVSTGNILKQFHDTAKASGAKVINSDFWLEIEGFEHIGLLTKQCPDPVLSTAGEIEVPMPLGSGAWQQQQLKPNGQGAISFMETTAATIDRALFDLIVNGGVFNAKIYEGTPEHYLRGKLVQDCFIQLDSPDRDWENRSQILTKTGTLFYHYFGEEVAGNSNDYR